MNRRHLKNELEPNIHQGIRDESFKKLITNLLRKAKISRTFITILTEPKNLEIFDQAFTHSTANLTKNYEVFEHLGDSIANTASLWYFIRRFPELNRPEGINILGKIKIKYVSKDSWHRLAEMMKLWEFVTVGEVTRANEKRKILEDVFESFIGVTTFLIDSRIHQGAGYAFSYNLITYLVKSHPIIPRCIFSPCMHQITKGPMHRMR